MKMFNKTLVAGAILAFAAFGSAYADEGLSFENKMETDTILLNDASDDYHKFPGITESMQVTYEGEKVDAKLKLQFTLNGHNEDVAGEKKTQIDLSDLEADTYYIKFRPIEILQIALADRSSREYAAGSYFPVLDDNVFAGNYTGNLGLLLKPVVGLAIGAGIDLPSDLYNDVDDDADNIRLNFGAEYNWENIGSFAVAFNNVANNFQFGVFAKVSAISALDIYGGFTVCKENTYLLSLPPLTRVTANNDWVVGKVLMNAGVEYKGIDKLTLAADLATNFISEPDTYGYYDFYTGIKAEYEINEIFSISGTSTMLFDFADNRNEEDYDYCHSPIISFYPEAKLKLGNHTFTAGLKMEFWKTYNIIKDGDRDTRFGASIPLSWTYAF